MKKPILIFILPAFLLGACGTSESTIQTAIAQTQAANPTATYTPQPTNTLPPTFTPQPTPTPDLRVIKTRIKEFLLSLSDLPPEGKYYLPNASWTSPHLNSEIIQDRGAEAGNKYISETGRIEGWWVDYLRGSNTVPVPKEIYDNPVMFQTAAGAQLLITKYLDDVLANGFVEIMDAPKYGDISRTFVKKDGSYIYKNIYFSYRNISHGVSGYGLESEVTDAFMEKVINALLAKLENVPLSPPD